MDAKFAATTIARTGKSENQLEITLCDAHGRTTTVSVPADVADCLMKAMRDFAGNDAQRPALTKRPREFAIGTGRHENAVLIRFDDDVPYGIDASTAIELGHALLDAAQTVSQRPARHLQ